MKARWLLLAVGSLGLLTLAVAAADWPQWRGPNRNGHSPETGLPQQWPKEGPKLLWQRKDLGFGYASPAVVGDRLYVLGNHGPDDEYVQARSVADGKPLWTARLGKVGPNQGPQYPGARSTPTVDGDVLFALGSDGDLACLETASGKVRWHKNLRTAFAGTPGQWAYSESPLVDGDVLVCTPGGDQATIVALNKKTGDVVWKCATPEGDEAAYASPIIVEVGGIKQYVQFLQKGLVGVDAKTGKLLWRYDKTAQGSPANIPTPLARDGFVYSSSGRGGAGLVKLSAKGGKIVAEPVYYRKDLPTSLGGAVLVGDYLYGTNARGLICADFKSGQPKWQEESIGPGSVCYADGRLYLFGEKDGEVVLVEPAPEGFREKGRFTPPGQPDRGRSKAWAYPAIADGRLYLRDLDMLWCYDIGK